MLSVLLCIQLFGQVWSQVLPPPQDVHVDSLLRWTPAPEHRNVTYTAQYRSFDNKWYNIPACNHTQRNSCDVTSLKAELKAKAEAEAEDNENPEAGCVELRVRAQEHNLTSRWVEACSRRGDLCSPKVQLTARPEYLTVNLSSNNSMVLKHAAQAQHRVYFGREGEQLKKYDDCPSSKTIKNLKEGARYCVEVQYILYHKPLGPRSCALCEVIPQSSAEITKAKIIASVGTVAFLFIVLTAISYFIIFHRETIKRWMQPPYSTPECILQLLPERHPVTLSVPAEEPCDQLTSIFKEEESCERA